MEPITSYAQNFEDVMLWRALGHVAEGRYIDIGAQDPIVDSVSMGFFEKGWRGVHAEANPEYATELREARPGDIVIEALVSSEHGIADFHAIEGTGLSTFNADVAKAHLENSGFQSRVVPVPRVTLDDVFGLVPDREVHWLKIDVEGAERAVLEGWRCARRPWVVVVESVHPVTRAPTQSDWEHLLLGRDYTFVYADGLNRFYLHQDHSDLATKFSAPPNVIDLFRLSGTATSSFSSLVSENAAQEISKLRLQKEEVSTALRLSEDLLSHTRERVATEEQRRETLEQALNHKDQMLEQLNARESQARHDLEKLSALLELREQLLTRQQERADAEEQERKRIEVSALRSQNLADLLASQMSSALQMSLQATRAARTVGAERDSLATQLFDSRRRLADHRSRAESLGQRLHDRELELARISEEIERASQREAALAKEVRDVLGSDSWRMTAPLRMLSSLLRGNMGYAKSTRAATVAQLDPHGLPRRALRRLLPAGSRMGELSRRQLYAPTVAESITVAVTTRADSGSTSSDLQRLLELTGVVSTRRRGRS